MYCPTVLMYFVHLFMCIMCIWFRFQSVFSFQSSSIPSQVHSPYSKFFLTWMCSAPPLMESCFRLQSPLDHICLLSGLSLQQICQRLTWLSTVQFLVPLFHCRTLSSPV